MKKFFKIIGILILIILLIIGVALWMLTKEKYQNILTQEGTKYLSEKLNTKVSIGHVKISILNDVNFQNVYIEDQQKDTLAYIGGLHVKTNELLKAWWYQETPILENLHLEDVFVHLKRERDTSIWNYDFISEAFVGNKNDTTRISDTLDIKRKEPSNQPKFDLKHIHCERIKFYMDDAWRGEDMHYALQEFTLNIESFNLTHKKIKINELLISEANAYVKEYEGGKPEDLTPDDTASWGTPFNTEKLNIEIRDIAINNGEFQYIDGDEKPKAREFDEKQLGITGINLHLKNTNIVDDTLFTKIENLVAKERCGLEIKSFQSDVKLSQIQTSLSNLVLQTNHSLLKHHYEMNYKNFHDFNDYIEKVNMKANLRDSYISSTDLGYFANILNQYPIKIKIAGDVNGIVGDLAAQNLSFSTLKTSFYGNAHMIGLPDIDNTIFDVQAKQLNTTSSDLNQLIPQTKVDAIAWQKLNKINFEGNYKGKVDDFLVSGKLNTNLGNSALDVKMNFKPKIPTYSGKFETNNFDLGTLLKQSTLGKLSMKGTLDGQGFDMNELDANVKATISSMDVRGYRYTDLTINGIMSNKKFDGIFVSQDPNLDANLDGKLDLNSKQPTLHFNSRFNKFDLQKLGFTKEPMSGSVYASLNFSGDNIDNFVGNAILKEVNLETRGKNFYANNINLNSSYDNGKKILQLRSPFADADMTGSFKISDLPATFQMYLYHYLPQYIRKPKTNFSTQLFTYNTTLKNIEPLLNVFVPNLYGLENSFISGNLNTEKQLFSIDAFLPFVGYQKFKIDSLQIIGAGDFNSFDLNVVTQQFYYNDETIVPSMQLNSSMAKDTASLTINTQSINTLLGEASLNCKATARNSNLYVDVLPSKLNINNLTWNFSCNKELIFGKQIIIQDFLVESGPQKIILNTEENETSDLIAQFENIDLENISQIANVDGPQFIGLIKGNIKVKDFMDDAIIDAKVSSISNVRIDNDTVGIVTAKISYDVNNKLLEIDKESSISNFDSYANISGKLNANDSTIDINTSLSRLNISFVNQFLADYIQNLRGLATGDVHVKGSLSSPNISGNVNLNAASLKVLFLGTSYFIEDAKFRFNNEKIEIMDKIVFKDERMGNHEGVIKGEIFHSNFKKFKLNINLNSPNLLCLKTEDDLNQLFYGYIPARVNARIEGYLNEVEMSINAKPLKGAQFHLPINSSGDASTYEFIKFKSIGRNQSDGIEDKTNSSSLKLGMTIEATPDLETYIILDRNTGEEIVAKGNGSIILNIDLGNSIDMTGSYRITEGKYKFNFRGLLPKEFIIDEDSRIDWTGDALAADMKVKAIYKLPNPLPLYPLVNDQLQSAGDKDPDLEEAKKPYTTFVDLNLKGSLSKPDITFDIRQPENKATASLGYTTLERIKSNEQELVSQAGVLLLLGNFKASEGGVSSSSYGQEAISSASDLITSALSSELNNQFRNLTGIKGINLNVDHRSVNSIGGDNLNNRELFSLNVTANLWKDKIILDAGNTVDVGRNTANGGTNSSYLGDFKAYYMIKPDGRLRLSAYRTPNTNLEGENFYKSGFGLSYRKVFNSFAELFISPKRKTKIIDSLKTNS